MSLQEALRQMRLELGITQMDLAAKVNKSFLTVNRWENGKGFPSRDNAKSILGIARQGGVSEECYQYLWDILKPDVKRSKSARAYGFPDIDRDFLFQLADNSANSLYVVEADTYRILYANRQAEKSAATYASERDQTTDERRLLDQEDRRCFHYFGGLDSPCPFCPMREIGQKKSLDKIVTIPEGSRTMHVHAKAFKTKKHKVYSIYLTDMTQRDAEINALYKLTNDIPHGVGIYNVYYDKHIELAFMNEHLYKMIGEERKEALLQNGRTDLCLVHPEDKERMWEEIKTGIRAKMDIEATLRMRVVDRQYHQVHLHGKLIKRDKQKSTFYCMFQIID